MASYNETMQARTKKSLSSAEYQVEKVVIVGREHFRSSVTEGVRDHKETFPAGTLEDFMALLPRLVFGADWTKEEERQLRHDISQRADWANLCTVNGILVRLFKTYFKFTGHLVTDVIGFSTGLVYKATDYGQARNKR